MLWRGLPILCLALGCAAVVQPLGWNERSHYAQVLAFNAGTPIIDAYAGGTGDVGVFHGHLYSDKAPGLAFLSVPLEHVVRGIGLTSQADDTHAIHVLAIFGCLIPAALLLVMLSRFVERYQPGRGVAVAMMLGLGSLLLPFSTLFFSHVLAACLGFAAYYLLWLERGRRNDPVLLGGAGVLAGLAVTTEYPLAILACLLGAYVIRRPNAVKRGLLYGAGLLVGIAPLLLYDWWAFGSPTHVSYSNVAANHVGLFGLVGLKPHVALDLLFGARGLFTLTPVVAVAVAGIVLLYRDGRRSEAWTAAVVGLAYLVYNASYYLPYGGWTPGPRFLIPVIPFIALPLASALRRLPVLTVVLAVVSAAMMIAATLTLPELPDTFSTSVWWDRLVHGEFSTPGAGGAVAWFAVLITVSVALTARMTRRAQIRRSQFELAGIGLIGWLLIARSGENLLGGNLFTGDVALVLLVVAVSAAVCLWLRRDAIVLLATALLMAFSFPAITRHYSWAALLGAASLSLMAVAELRRRKERHREEARVGVSSASV